MRPAVSDCTNKQVVSTDDQYAQHIRCIVESAPRLTPEQRDRLAVLLQGHGAAK